MQGAGCRAIVSVLRGKQCATIPSTWVQIVGISEGGRRHPTLYTLHPTLTLHSTPYTLHPIDPMLYTHNCSHPAITALFSLELLINLLSHSANNFKEFYTQGSNWFDTFIVLISISNVLLAVMPATAAGGSSR